MTSRQDLETMIHACSLGDREAFSMLYDATSAKLFGVCLRVLNNRASAEEVLQDVFVKIWRNADRYAANGYSPMTWLITIARNAAIDRLRAERPSEDLAEVAERLPSGAPTPEAAAIAASEVGRVMACLEQLEPDRRNAVRGAYLDGWSYIELAQRFGVPLNTMKTWLRRSLARLKDCVTQ